MQKQNINSYLRQFEGIKILTIQDKTTIKSSCAISINVGSTDEPEKVPGLAHLLEHMIFTSSQKFPASNQYSSFFSSHSGYENAQTCDFHSNYFFQIASEHFQEAIVRMCDCFCNPLLTESSILAQIQAVHQEFVLAGNDDESRLEQINKLCFNAPLNRFFMGNKLTLTVDSIREHLKQLHNKYRANSQITAVLYTNLSWQQVENNILPYLCALPQQSNGGVSFSHRYEIQAIPVLKSNRFMTMKSIQNEDNLYIQLVLNFCKNETVMKEYLQLDDGKKMEYLKSLAEFGYVFGQCVQYIVGHDSQASLIHYMQQLDYIYQIDCSLQQVVPFTQYLLTISFSLQQQQQMNEQKCAKIYTKLQSYLAHYLTPENIRRAHKELSYLSGLEERNLQVNDMEEYLFTIARDLYLFHPKSVVLGGYTMADSTHLFKQKQLLLAWSIQQLVYSKNKIIVYSTNQQLKGQIKIQPFLGTTYTISQLSHYFPQFSPHLSLTSTQKKYLLPENPLLPLKQVGHPSINTPQLPCKLDSHIHFYNPGSSVLRGGVKLIFHNMQDYVFNSVFIQFMDLYTQGCSDCHHAEVIGLDYYFDYQQGTLFFYIFGYNELVIHMMAQIGTKIKQLIQSIRNGSAKNDENIRDLFNQALDSLQEDLDNYYEQEMDYLIDKIRDQLLIQASPPLHVILKQAKKIKKNKFLQRAQILLTTSVIEWIAVGNFSSKQMHQAIQHFQANLGNENKLNCSQTQSVRQTKVMKLEGWGIDQRVKLQIRLHSPQIQTSTCFVYFQAGPYSHNLFWLLQILEMHLDQPFYEHVRTLKKLSYDLQINVVNTRGILGICFMLTSSKIDPQLISRQIHEFLQKHVSKQTLKQSLQSQFENLKKSISTKYAQPFDSVQDCFDFVSDEVIGRSFYFQQNVPNQVEQRMKKISIDQIIEAADQIFGGNSLQILFVSKIHKNMYSEHKPKTIALDQIKQNSEYYKDMLANLSFNFKTS